MRGRSLSSRGLNKRSRDTGDIFHLGAEEENLTCSAEVTCVCLFCVDGVMQLTAVMLRKQLYLCKCTQSRVTREKSVNLRLSDTHQAVGLHPSSHAGGSFGSSTCVFSRVRVVLGRHQSGFCPLHTLVQRNSVPLDFTGKLLLSRTQAGVQRRPVRVSNLEDAVGG